MEMSVGCIVGECWSGHIPEEMPLWGNTGRLGLIEQGVISGEAG